MDDGSGLMSDRSAPVAALILAAGESARMGRPKALLDWGGKPLLQHQIDVLLAAGCTPVVVVLGHEAQRVRARIRCEEPCRSVENAGYGSGRASSVRVGALALADDVGAVVIVSVDQPCGEETVRELMGAWRGGTSSIVVARHEGKNGHPALFDGALLPELRTVQEESEGLRAVRASHRERTDFVDVDDALVTLNLNTMEAYEAARARFSASTG
ncbi:MAG: nucleotidyltransferase family protein [Dehalococcoidia bacterium]